MFVFVVLARFHVLKLKAIGGDTWALKFYGRYFSVCLPASLRCFIMPVQFAKGQGIPYEGT